METFDLIMTNKEYIMVRDEYEHATFHQSKFDYKIRRFLSENVLTKWLCCCLKVKDELDIPWEEMTVP